MVAGLAGFTFSFTRAQAAPPAGAVATIASAVSAVNSGDAKRLDSLFTPDAFVVDDFPPFVWRMPHAGAAWVSDLEASLPKAHVTRLHAVLQPITQYTVSPNGDTVYAVAPLVVSMTQSGKVHTQRGLWAMTLHRTGGTWKVTSASWATASES
jgi:ketosteroid isomerase-like protein